VIDPRPEALSISFELVSFVVTEAEVVPPVAVSYVIRTVIVRVVPALTSGRPAIAASFELVVTVQVAGAVTPLAVMAK